MIKTEMTIQLIMEYDTFTLFTTNKSEINQLEFTER
jgi:hypothetical protein